MAETTHAGADPDASRAAAVPPPDPGLADAAEVFAAVRPRLFGVAYRMLGSVADAEDLLQEAWLRWQTCDRSAVREPAAFLTTTVTRLALNAVTSARARREAYVGPWLPEPVDTSADPQLGAERVAALEPAVLLLLERLTPAQRAAYVLREAFGYPYGEIGAIVRTSEAAARQLVSRARRHLDDTGGSAPVDGAEQRRLMSAFLAAAHGGELEALERLFAEDVVSHADGGGVRRAARFPVRGARTVAKYILAFRKRYWPGMLFDTVEANGVACVRMRMDGDADAYGLVTVSASGGGIDRVLWQLNPRKLGRW